MSEAKSLFVQTHAVNGLTPCKQVIQDILSTEERYSVQKGFEDQGFAVRRATKKTDRSFKLAHVNNIGSAMGIRGHAP